MKPTFLKYGLLTCGESKQLSWSHMILSIIKFWYFKQVLGLEWGIIYLLMGWENKIQKLHTKKKAHLFNKKGLLLVIKRKLE
jgi:hypothetical protein